MHHQLGIAVVVVVVYKVALPKMLHYVAPYPNLKILEGKTAAASFGAML